MSNKILILDIGTKFGNWKIISSEVIRKNNLTHWKCKCICGKEEFVPLNNLMNGKSKQCKNCAAKSSGIHRRKGYNEITGQMWSELKRKAEIKKIPFEIRIEYAWELFEDQNNKCGITNREIILTGY